MVPLDKFDISLKNTPPGLAPFCTESWQRFPTIFFSISLAPADKVVSGHTKNYGKHGKLKEFTEKRGNLCGGERQWTGSARNRDDFCPKICEFSHLFSRGAGRSIIGGGTYSYIRVLPN